MKKLKELKEKNQILTDDIHSKLYIVCFFIIGIAIMMSILATTSSVYGDDYWWHVKAGEWIVKNHRVPTNGIYSWYAIENNLEWFAHEWLSEVVLYGFTAIFGDNGGVYYIAINILLITILLIVAIKKYWNKNFYFYILWFLIGRFLIGFTSAARPHMFSYVLFILLLMTCEKIRNDENSKIYLLFPFVSIIWANWHGGSSNLVYIIPFIYLITTSINFKIGRLKNTSIYTSEKKPFIFTKKTKNYFILILLNFIALFLNPRTYQLIYYPYSYTDEHSKYIIEWMSSSLSNIGKYVIVVIMLIAIILISCKNKELDITDMSLIGCFIILSMKSVRFESWLFIVTTFFIFKYIGELKITKEDMKLIYLITVAFFSLLVLIICNLPFLDIDKSVSDEAISVIKETDCDRMYNDYGLGSYLIYEDINVFIDGRADMYSGHNMTQNGKISIGYSSDYSYEDFLEEFNFDMFVVLPESYLNYRLSMDSNYTTIYSGDDCNIYIEK